MGRSNSRWKKLQVSLENNFSFCLYSPKTSDEATSAPPPPPTSSPAPPPPVVMPTTPMPSSSGLLLPRQYSSSSSKSCSISSSKSLCAICLRSMKPGNGHAIFTAECSHAFHFHCITSNVKHGKQVCPICRAKWKEIPFHSPATDKSLRKGRVNSVPLSPNDDWTTAMRPMSSTGEANRYSASGLSFVEPNVFDDDDEISSHQSSAAETSTNVDGNASGVVEIQMFPEISAVAKSKCHDDFAILVHLKAPVTPKLQDSDGVPSTSQNSRASVDLVTVLDVSGSMSGTKLALLKRAMGFVIQNLGSSDRLSVIAFSSTARRVLPLCRMTAAGKFEALQAVNSLSSNGGTNIAEGLRKGAKVINDRRWKNPVASIMLLSDGQDTYTISAPVGAHGRVSCRSLLPVSMQRDNGFQIPVHAFGFGSDHDAVSMHSISELSGGTFSFIEAESMIQDAFAQCIGGLLSVVVQDLNVEIECIDPIPQLMSVKSGSYKTSFTRDRKRVIIRVGDLYAEEERDFLVTINIPVHESGEEMSLLKVKCIYTHPVTNNTSRDSLSDVKIQRPVVVNADVLVSMEVDKQRNRNKSAEAMSEAKIAAERGDLASAVSILQACRKYLSETPLAQSGDRMYAALDAELMEMQERMANRQVYETSGRAYVLSGLSSHSWQRATARGDSTQTTTCVLAYQTPSMVDMVNLSQTMVFGAPSPRRGPIRHTQSFNGNTG